MSSNEEKLENFQKNCYDMADLESKTIMDKINNEINDDINQELKEYEKEMAKKYEEKLKRLEQKYNTDIFNLNNDARYKVVEKENEAKNEIKREVVKKIMLFKQTDEYFAFLTRNINQAMENLKIEDSFLKFRSWDRKHSNSVQDLCGSREVKIHWTERVYTRNLMKRQQNFWKNKDLNRKILWQEN